MSPVTTPGVGLWVPPAPMDDMVLKSGPGPNQVHWAAQSEIDFEQSYVQQWAGVLGVATSTFYNIRPWCITLAEHQTASLLSVTVDCLGGAEITFNVVYGHTSATTAAINAQTLSLNGGSSVSWSPSPGVDLMDGDYLGIRVLSGTVDDVAVTYRLSTQIFI